MKINCDLGEGLDTIDAQVMPYINMASIACGGHAGDPQSMLSTVMLAQQHKVEIGAHPSYPDRENFGRVSMAISPEKLFDALCIQVQALTDCAQSIGQPLSYIKPHGALYTDASCTANVREILYKLASHFGLPLVLQALPAPEHHSVYKDTQPFNISLCFEAFADRAYTDAGKLVARSQANSVHNSIDKVLQQAKYLVDQHGVFSEHNNWLNIHAETLCVHSDSPNAVPVIKALHAFLNPPTH